jgi:hypothetical protein
MESSIAYHFPIIDYFGAAVTAKTRGHFRNTKKVKIYRNTNPVQLAKNKPIDMLAWLYS